MSKKHASSIVIACLAMPISLWATQAQANEALAKKYACVACHQAEKKVVGPAWKEIAAKYKDTISVEELAARIKKGGSGKWGPVPMPAQGTIPDADLTSLATWILHGAS